MVSDPRDAARLPAGGGGGGSPAAPVTAGPGRAPGIPGYEILGELGRGGMGVVYRARQVGLDRVVALKMVLAGTGDGATHARERADFRREAEAVARLNHPNFVHIYEVGEHEGRPYFSMELVEGGGLSARIAGVPQPPMRSATWVRTLAAAMHHAHQRGLVHRDLKPANVLLTADGVMKIADFGLVHRLDKSTTGHSAEEIIAGTPAYMAPEQLGEDSRAVGPATDVYALGAILYEMLAARPRFATADPMDLMHRLANTDPEPVRKFRPEVPADLETICMKCLRRKPEERYASAAALAEDLDAFLAGEPIKARPVGAVERTWRWCRRNPAPVGLMAAVTLASAVGVWTLAGLPDRLMRSAALDAAAQEAETLDVVNNVYTADVVERLRPRGVQITHDWEQREGAIPIPATMTIHLGKRISEQSKAGVEVRVYSDLPFKGRTDGGPRDEFERAALEQLRRKPDQPAFGFEDYRGRFSLRYATARTMKEGCVKCHNSHPDSPRKDWKVGEVRGVVEIIRPLDRDAERAREGLTGTFLLMAAIAAAMLTATGAAALMMARARRRPVKPAGE
jgi:hypothetical protein